MDKTVQALSTLRRRRAALLAKLSVPPNFVRASCVEQYLTCGKKNCRCHRKGQKHGPFLYFVQSLGINRTRKFLLKTPEQRRQARAGIAAHAKFLRQLAQISEINTEMLRRGEL